METSVSLEQVRLHLAAGVQSRCLTECAPRNDIMTQNEGPVKRKKRLTKCTSAFKGSVLSRALQLFATAVRVFRSNAARRLAGVTATSVCV